MEGCSPKEKSDGEAPAPIPDDEKLPSAPAAPVGVATPQQKAQASPAACGVGSTSSRDSSTPGSLYRFQRVSMFPKGLFLQFVHNHSFFLSLKISHRSMTTIGAN